MKYFKVTVRRSEMHETFIATATNEKKLQKELPSLWKHLEIKDDVLEVGVVKVKPIKYRGVTLYPIDRL